MLNVRLAGGHLHEKQLFTWLSLVVSLTASYCAVFFPLDDLDEILDVIGSVSEGFLTYSFSLTKMKGFTHIIEMAMANKNNSKYFNVGHLFTNIYGQILVVHLSECIYLHFYSSLQSNTIKTKIELNKYHVQLSNS